MLKIDVVTQESFDEENNRFTSSGTYRVELEHSLVSVSKWESFWEVPFLGKEAKTTEQTVSYVKMMIQDDDLPTEVFQKLLKDHLDAITTYVEAKMTATTISELKGSQGYQEVITSELIYYWMVSMNIPVECQYWHLNRLITLIRVINVKNSPKKKMSMAERRSLNRQRLAKNNSRG